MILMSLLIVLLIERITTKSKVWQAEFYSTWYINTVQSIHLPSKLPASWSLPLTVILPSLLVYWAIDNLNSGIIELIVSTLVLMVCIGCPKIREAYKCYLHAAKKGDSQACDSFREQIDMQQPDITFGQQLIWQNYRHYAAVILWFAALGPAGAIFYVLTRDLVEYYQQHDLSGAKQGRFMLGLLDWIPVRITAFGFLVIGHFSRALSTWLGYLPDPSTQAKTLLLKVAKKAEEIEPKEEYCTEEPCTLVRMAKRNIMFLLVLIAATTLMGVTH